nr:MAG TPA: hypothetical protein [Caudoviricetes sp.]
MSVQPIVPIAKPKKPSPKMVATKPSQNPLGKK